MGAKAMSETQNSREGTKMAVCWSKNPYDAHKALLKEYDSAEEHAELLSRLDALRN